MSTFQETLEMVIHADASGAIGEVKKFANESDKSLKESELSFQRVGAGILKAGGAVLAFGTTLQAMASGDIQAQKGLEASVNNVGQSYIDFKDRIEQTAAAQAKFGHTDEEVNNSLSTLVLSYNDTGAALDRMQLVADLAAKKNISLAAAADIVAKAHGGAAKIFKEFNITVDSNTKNANRFDEALDQLSQKLSGQASASVSGFTGWLVQMRAELENQASAFAQQWGPAIQTGGAALTVVGGTIAGVSKGLDVLKGSHVAAMIAAEGQTEAEVGLGTALAAGGLYLAGGVAVAGIAVGAFSALADALNGNVKATDEYSAAIASNTGFLDRNVDAVTAQQIATNKAVTQARDAGVSMTALAQAVRNGTEDWGKYTDYLAAVNDLSGSSKQIASELGTALRGAGADTSEFGRALIDAAESGRLNKQQLLSLISEVEGLHNGYTDASSSASNLKSVQDALGVSTADNTKKDKEAADALKALNDARQKELDLVNERVGGAIALSNAQIAERAAVADLITTVADHKKTEDERTKALNDAETSIMAVGSAAKDMAAKQAEATGATDAAKVATLAEITSLQGVADTLAPGSQLRNWLDEYIATLKSTPTYISTTFAAVGPGGGPPQVKVGSGQYIASAKGYDGWIDKPTPFLIGEGGEPEYVSVTPKSKMGMGTRGMSSAGVSGGGGTTVVQLVLDGKVLTQVVLDGLASDARRNGNATLNSLTRAG